MKLKKSSPPSPTPDMEPQKPTPAAIYTALVAYIVSVVPEIETRGWDHWNDEMCMDKITLEDVLRALALSGKNITVTYGDRLFYFHSILEEPNRWHLGKPLHGQSDELKSFLHSILVPTP